MNKIYSRNIENRLIKNFFKFQQKFNDLIRIEINQIKNRVEKLEENNNLNERK